MAKLTKSTHYHPANPPKGFSITRTAKKINIGIGFVPDAHVWMYRAMVARINQHMYDTAEARGESRDVAEAKYMEKCPGEAHSNPWIDNCGLCMPNWGVRPKRSVVS